MEDENQGRTETVEELVQEFPLLEELAAKAEPPQNAKTAEESQVKPEPVPQPKLQKDLENALQRVQQLERERWLLSQGIPEEDLDYYSFKIGSLVTPGKDFAAAAREYLKTHRRRQSGSISTAAGLGGRVSKAPGINETMNRLIRGE